MAPLAVCLYLAVGVLMATGFLGLLHNPPEHDSEWELFRAAYRGQPQYIGLTLLLVCAMFWPFILLAPRRK